MSETPVTVLRFADRRLPLGVGRLPVRDVTGVSDIDAVLTDAVRLAVLGDDADLAAVLTRMLRADRLDVEVVPVRGFVAARRAVSGSARRVPLIRDDTGTVLVGSALWLPPEGAASIRGEAVADDTVLFDGQCAGLRIEPTRELPGLRARVLGRRGWVSARAVQLGTTGARVLRDGVPAPREVRRSTFYRHTTGWLRV